MNLILFRSKRICTCIALLINDGPQILSEGKNRKDLTIIFLLNLESSEVFGRLSLILDLIFKQMSHINQFLQRHLKK